MNHVRNIHSQITTNYNEGLSCLINGVEVPGTGVGDRVFRGDTPRIRGLDPEDPSSKIPTPRSVGPR